MNGNIITMMKLDNMFSCFWIKNREVETREAAHSLRPPHPTWDLCGE